MFKTHLLGVFFLTFSLFAREVSTFTIYNIPSPMGIDWTTPRELFQSTKKNRSASKVHKKIRRHGIGHSYIELTCKSEGKTTQHILNGMTMKSYPRKLCAEMYGICGAGEYGLGLLFYTFKGRFDVRVGTPFEQEDYEDAWNDIYKRSIKGFRDDFFYPTQTKLKRSLLSFLTFEITSSQCQDLVDYFYAYKNQGGNLRYGNSVHPLDVNGQLNTPDNIGSGCSEFAMSFLSQLNFITPEMDQKWKQKIHIPNSLIGYPEQEIFVRRNKLAKSELPWGTRKDDHHTYFEIWDPELMHYWTEEVWNKIHENQRITELKDSFHIQTTKMNKAKGLILKSL